MENESSSQAPALDSLIESRNLNSSTLVTFTFSTSPPHLIFKSSRHSGYTEHRSLDPSPSHLSRSIRRNCSIPHDCASLTQLPLHQSRPRVLHCSHRIQSIPRPLS
ncbi:hypothetical protein HYQ45_000953 [Verticillium longisporum]|uniref:Uncharacterized protein n=1 Tax=Verticillium longisporum TaxID=100787 RepID=A0A8I3AX76_VERLO|nr:hypothetical protein HYQ45_000953 [Verticillium longisporum]